MKGGDHKDRVVIGVDNKSVVRFEGLDQDGNRSSRPR